MKTKDKSPFESEVGAAEAKSRLLELLEVVRREGREFVITKRGDPVARLLPVSAGRSQLRGLLRGQVVLHGDVVHLDFGDEWETAR